MIIRIAAYVVSLVLGTAGGFFGGEVVAPQPVLPEPVSVTAPTSTPVSALLAATTTTTTTAAAATPKTVASQTKKAEVTPPPVRAETNGGLRENFFRESPPKAPTPVSTTVTSSQSGMTAYAIIAATNAERTSRKLGSLSSNQQLSEMAEAKMNDMFAKEYFAHDSPTGVTVTDLADDAGYEFLLIGENLAHGNFKTAQSVVDAWMASPGHRENILKEHYSEIGVAVRQGSYKGKTVWIAVQEFGHPLSVCDKPSVTLREEIDNGNIKLAKYKAVIEKTGDAVNAETVGTSAYANAASNFNTAVGVYNSFLAEHRKRVEAYNASVGNYNSCVDAETD